MIILVSVPRLNPMSQSALFKLSQNIEQDGLTCNIYNANLDLYDKFYNTEYWNDLETWGIQNNSLEGKLKAIVEMMSRKWAKEILAKNPTHIGISVFTHESRGWTEYLCKHLKKLSPDTIIILGGAGLNTPGIPYAEFGKKCLEDNLCDAYFNGEAEQELLKYIKNESCIVNNEEPLTCSLNYNYQNQDHPHIDTDWYIYDNDSTTISETNVYIAESTRGCVKRCTFCDVPLIRNYKFDIKNPNDLIEELKKAIDSGKNKIQFTDSMINGSNSSFIIWLEKLANHLEKNNICDFFWKGQYGFKSIKNTPNEVFDLLSRTNAHLNIGMDHLSDNVLKHMRKQYTYEDIIWNLENTKNKISNCIFVIGYPTETIKDFELLKSRFKEVQQYDCVKCWDFGTTCSVPVGSELSKLPGIETQENQIKWYWPGNPTLTLDERIRRRKEIEQIAIENDLTIRKQRTQWKRIEKWID